MARDRQYKGIATFEELMRKFDLTEQQAKACLFFLGHNKKTRAMREAGYSEATALKGTHAVFGRPNVKAAIRWLQDQQAERAMISADHILGHILEIANEAKETGDHAAALRAYELLGKNLGMWVDKREITHKNPFSNTDDPEELQKNIERMAKIAAPKLKVVEGGKS